VKYFSTKKVTGIFMTAWLNKSILKEFSIICLCQNVDCHLDDPQDHMNRVINNIVCFSCENIKLRWRWDYGKIVPFSQDVKQVFDVPIVCI